MRGRNFATMVPPRAWPSALPADVPRMSGVQFDMT